MPNWSTRVLSTAPAEITIWRSFFDRCRDRDVYSMPEYMAILQRHFDASVEAFVYGDDNSFVLYPYYRQPIDAATLAEKRELFDLVSSWYYGGPIIECDDSKVLGELVSGFVEAFETHCQTSGYVTSFLRFDPHLRNATGFEDRYRLQTGRPVVYFDLEQSMDEIRAGFSQTCRKQLRRAERSDCVVTRRKDEEAIRQFAAIYTAEMERKTAPLHYRFDADLLTQMISELSDHFELFVAERSDRIVAGTLCCHGFGTVHDFLRAADPDHLDCYPSRLLVYENLVWAKKAGYRIYDLQSGRAGVFAFKQSFSKLQLPYYTAQLVHDEVLYESLVEQFQTMHGVPEDAGDFFPVYRSVSREVG